MSLTAEDTERDMLGVPNWTVTETLRNGWKACPELRKGAGITVGFAFLGTTGRLVLPVLLQRAIDRGFNDGAVNVGLVVQLAIIGVVVVAVAQWATWEANLRMGREGEHALMAMRKRAFARIHSLSVAQQADFRRGVLVARVTSDLENVSHFFEWGGTQWLLDVSLMLVTAIVMFVYDPLLAAIVIGVSLPLFVLLRALQQRLVSAYSDVRNRNADFLSSVSELVAGAPVIRAYGAERVRADRALATARELRATSVRAGSLSALLFPTGEMFSSFAVAGIVAVGVWRSSGGHLTAGSLIAFIFLAYRFLEPIGELTEVLDNTQTAVAGWRRVLGLIAMETTVPPPVDGCDLPLGPPSIALKDVTFHYPARPGDDADNEPALRNVSFHIEPSSHVAVVGATGSGKTTLARLLTRLADPTDGHVLVADIDLRDVNDASLRHRVVLVPQEPFLFNTTIGDNVRMGQPDATPEQLTAAFVDLGLQDWLAGLPDGLSTTVGERGENLSAGERQLVALARASVASPSCLVLDEATSSVDPGTEATLAEALDRLANGRTSIVIAHRLSTAARADRILVFDQGRLVQDGSHDELVDADGIYAGLYASWLSATSSVPGSD
jgi:ATP-binding cassette, subfamily B, bacterial